MYLSSTLHVEWVQKAAERGLHVLLEKPIAVSEEDLGAILRACEKNSVTLMDGTTHVVRMRLWEILSIDRREYRVSWARLPRYISLPYPPLPLLSLP